MTTKLTWKEFQRIKDIKVLDIQLCDFCKKLNILNLGWKTFKELYCLTCEEKHVLCLELCYKASLNIFGCELYRREKPVEKEVVPPNRPYDLASCYLCGKELKGAGKTGKIKNRNNPGFWGIESEWKILCLSCMGKKFYKKMVDWQRKKFREYIRRGYV